MSERCAVLLSEYGILIKIFNFKTLTRNVVDYDGDGGVTDVRGDERPEPLLARRFPQLEANLSARKQYKKIV